MPATTKPLDLEPRPATPRASDRYEVAAEGLGRYLIEVSLPDGYEQAGASYPVILATDGNLLFDLAQTAIHGRFAATSPALPPSIVVGVGYPADEGMAGFYARRNHDFHGDWAMTDPLGQTLQRIFEMLKKAEGKPEMTMHAGGYSRFMAFLRDELLPALARRYRIDPAARHTLIGDSSGGHFVLRALFDPTSPFRRYVAISPGFGSAEGSIQRAEAEYAAGHDDLDAEIFVCCGTAEVARERLTALCRFGSGVTWIAEQLAIRGWPSARCQWEIMNNEDHHSIAPRAIAAGLRAVHGARPGVDDEKLAQRMAAALEAMRAGPGR